MDRSGKMFWSVKSLHHKHEHFSSHSWHPSEKPDVLPGACNPRTGELGWGQEDLWSLLFRQSFVSKFQVQPQEVRWKSD